MEKTVKEIIAEDLQRLKDQITPAPVVGHSHLDTTLYGPATINYDETLFDVVGKKLGLYAKLVEICKEIDEQTDVGERVIDEQTLIDLRNALHELKGLD